MATIDEIKQQAAAVKNATQVGENTAERVGGALAGLADIVKEQGDNIGKKADKDAVDAELDKKANTADVDTKFTEEKKRVDDELAKKANAEDVEQSFLEQTTKNTEQDAEIAKKANAEDVEQSFLEQTTKNTEQDAEIAKKANAEDVNNSIQKLDQKLNRNLLAIEFDDETGDLNAIIGQDSTISSVSTDEDGNVIIEQEIL